MKKHVMILLVLVSAVSIISAGTFSSGVSVGGNLAYVEVDPSSEGSPRYGLTGGLYGNYTFYSMGEAVDFSVQPGVYYTMKGFRAVQPTSPTTTTDLSVNNDYIELPILMKASFSLGLPVNSYVLAGPSVGYRIINNASTENPVVPAVETSVEAKYQDFDFGVVLGAGVDLDMGVSVDARFNLGLYNIEDAPTGDNYTKTRSISLMVSYNLL